jgi:hypothetical protein
VDDDPPRHRAAGDHAHDRVADLPPPGAGPEHGDVTGELEPRDIDDDARRRRVEAAALEQIGAVDARGGDLDGDLARARVAELGLAERDDLDPTGAAELDRGDAHDQLK